jgi:hypothetical protein
MPTKTEPVQRVTQAQPAPPGTRQPDPVLAAKGWHANHLGIWTRRREPGREADREAGQ